MTRLFLAIILVLTLAVPQAAAPACKTVYIKGRPVCVCFQVGKGWKLAPKAACLLWEVKPG